MDAKVGGKIAQVGQRLVDGAARKMADDFFNNFERVVAPGAAATEEGAEATGGSAEKKTDAGASGINWLWVGGGIAVVIVVLLLVLS